MQISEEFRGRFGGGHRVEAVIGPAILHEPILTTGLRHELPQAAGPDGRTRTGVEATLDHCEPQEILGYALPAQHLANRLAVAPRSFQPDREKRAPARIVFEKFEVANQTRLPANGELGKLEVRHPRQIFSAFRRRWGARDGCRRKSGGVHVRSLSRCAERRRKLVRPHRKHGWRRRGKELALGLMQRAKLGALRSEGDIIGGRTAGHLAAHA